ncbi:MAG: DUF5615 family PIN-like protein [Anaerolineaceae bacterium]|nr:DUF5615 family PIN-like protein [Anaerolineaceae bacterium]MCB9099894.1 DUF5615 family PIN-like protein [Anaerolineales bacterium]
MKFKLDENFGTRTQNIFRNFGHDVHTVREEALQGASDQQIYQVCCDEERCLVTLDLDFSDVVRFPPYQTEGIAVIRFPRNPSLALLESLARQFLQMLEKQSINKQLWIIEVGRVRIHQSDIDDE